MQAAALEAYAAFKTTCQSLIKADGDFTEEHYALLARIPHGESAAKPYRTAITGLPSVGGSSHSAAMLRSASVAKPCNDSTLRLFGTIPHEGSGLEEDGQSLMANESFAKNRLQFAKDQKRSLVLMLVIVDSDLKYQVDSYREVENYVQDAKTKEWKVDERKEIRLTLVGSQHLAASVGLALPFTQNFSEKMCVPVYPRRPYRPAARSNAGSPPRGHHPGRSDPRGR